MANKSYSKAKGSTTVKQRNTYSTPANNSAKMSANKPVQVKMMQKTNELSRQQMKAIFAKGTNAQIKQSGTGNKKIAMAVPKGSTVKVKGKSKVKVG